MCANSGLSVNDLQPTKLPDLVVLNGTYSNVANLTVDEGLAEVGLPTEYPICYIDITAYSVTQPIGATLHDAGHSSIFTRSASASSWCGPTTNWAELAIFVDNAPAPKIVERISHKDWL